MKQVVITVAMIILGVALFTIFTDPGYNTPLGVIYNKSMAGGSGIQQDLGHVDSYYLPGWGSVYEDDDGELSIE